MKLRYEPALIVAAVEAILVAGIAFGLDITAEQLAAVVFALTALSALVVRSSTTTKSYLGDQGVRPNDDI